MSTSTRIAKSSSAWMPRIKPGSTGNDRARRHGEQIQPGRERHSRRIAGGGACGGARILATAVPYIGGAARRLAGAADEHHQRRRARGQQRRHPGIHDPAARARRRCRRRCATAPRCSMRSRKCCTARGSTRRSATKAASRRICPRTRRRSTTILEAIDKAGYRAGKDIYLGLDVREQRVLQGRRVRARFRGAQVQSRPNSPIIWPGWSRSIPSSPSRTA